MVEESPVSEPWAAPSEAAILLKIESLDSGLTVLSRPGKAPHLGNHFSAIQGETVRQPEVSRLHKSSFRLDFIVAASRPFPIRVRLELCLAYLSLQAWPSGCRLLHSPPRQKEWSRPGASLLRDATKRLLLSFAWHWPLIPRTLCSSLACSLLLCWSHALQDGEAETGSPLFSAFD